MSEHIPDGGIAVFPPYGFIRLVDVTGSEIDVVNAARVSFAKESPATARYGYLKAYWILKANGLRIPEEIEIEVVKLRAQGLPDDDAGLLRWLLKNKHGSPFEKGFKAELQVRAPIFVFREWHRHRIGISINEESGRYTELRPHFYVPEGDAIRTQTGKPGSYKFEPVEDPVLRQWYKDGLEGVYRYAWQFYKDALEKGFAKEISRVGLPLGIYSEMRWSVNARSLMNFAELRSDKTAQFEIRHFSHAVERLFGEYMPTIHQAFELNGRVAP